MSEERDDLLKRANRAALCLEAWSQGHGPHSNVKEVSGALAETVRALIAALTPDTSPPDPQEQKPSDTPG